MSRKTFLTIVSCIALLIGSVALFAPGALLDSKGVAPSDAGNLWAREVGVALVSIGVAAALMRGHRDSPTLRAFLIGNAILQIGLFPIEIVGYANGVITKLSGIAPNSVLHLTLACAFVYYAARIKSPADSGAFAPGV
jgi:hypothetical protein